MVLLYFFVDDGDWLPECASDRLPAMIFTFCIICLKIKSTQAKHALKTL